MGSDTITQGSQLHTTWLYDQGVNGIGRLTRMNDATGNTVYSYDTQGRRLSTTQTTTFSGVSLTHTRSLSYDAAGRLSTQTYPSGLQISYGYDAQGRIASINLNGQPLLSNIAYRPFGAPKAWLWGNGQSYTRSFDADGRLSGYPIASDTRVLNYDLASRITGFGQTNPIYNRSFSYDPEDRLQTYQDNLGSQTYRYDTTGNRTGIDYGATAYLYTVATTSNRLTKVAGPVVKTYLYDAAGNPTSDGVITFTWDAANRLNKIASGKGKQAVSASYLYNGLSQRLIKTANVLINAPWRYVYDEAGHLIGEYDKNNAARQETVWLGDMPVAVVVKQTAPSTPTIYYVQADHLNTPRVILNNTNTLVWRWDNSDAFGVGLPDEDPDKDTVKFEYNPRFPGQYFDKETGLHYNYFRDYEPRTGRYVEADPIGLAGGSNLYLYANAAPTMYTDPLGLKPWDWNGQGNVSKCSYYDNMAKKFPKCDYYKQAGKICRGQDGLVNRVVNTGLRSAWLLGGQDSQATVLSNIRDILIQEDITARNANLTDKSGCTCGNTIDDYHNFAFDFSGLPAWSYGGNLWPQSISPNPVPADPRNGNLSPGNWLK